LTIATAPPTRVSAQPGDETYLAFLGDGGSADRAQLDVRTQLERRRAAGRLDAVFLLGDNVYDSGREIEEKYLAVYGGLLDAGVAFHAVLGNHDVQLCDGAEVTPVPPDEGAYRHEAPDCHVAAHLATASRFGYPDRRRYYSVRSAGDRSLYESFLLDSNTLDTEQRKISREDTWQLDWLASALRESTATWKIVAMHHPMHTPPGSDWNVWPFARKGHAREEGLRRQLERTPLVEHGRVDAVFQGHNHFYARLLPQGGVRYFVSGGGGADVYRYRPQPGYAAEVPDRGRFHHFVYVHLTRDRFEYCAIDAAGATRDGGWFAKGRAADMPFASGACPF
jgi:hypothetical protein